jgi:hypothetical protein
MSKSQLCEGFKVLCIHQCRVVLLDRYMHDLEPNQPVTDTRIDSNT